MVNNTETLAEIMRRLVDSLVEDAVATKDYDDSNVELMSSKRPRLPIPIFFTPSGNDCPVNGNPERRGARDVPGIIIVADLQTGVDCPYSCHLMENIEIGNHATNEHRPTRPLHPGPDPSGA